MISIRYMSIERQQKTMQLMSHLTEMYSKTLLQHRKMYQLI